MKTKTPNKKQFDKGQAWAAMQVDPRLQYLAKLEPGSPLRVLDLCGDEQDNCTFLGITPNAKSPVIVKHRGQIRAVELGNVLKAERDTDCGILRSGEAMCVAQPLTTADLDCVRNCDHEWVVFSTALQEVWLVLHCTICGAHGSVNDPTTKEWRKAYDAPSSPYAWTDKSRVTIRGLARSRCVVPTVLRLCENDNSFLGKTDGYLVRVSRFLLAELT